MRAFGWITMVLLISTVTVRTPPLGAQTPESTANLLLRFDAEHDLAAKERLLLTLTIQDPQAGPALLRLAQSTTNTDTRWMGMRGMASLHYAQCAPFLELSLKSDEPLVRANAARALSDLRIADASASLLAMFAIERNPAAVEQASLALRTLRVKAAVPYVREKISVFTGQTRAWLIQALGSLGDRSDLPLIAGYLDDEGCGDTATTAIEELTGVVFGPHRGGPTGCPSTETLAARAWWKSHRDAWPHCDDCSVPEVRAN